jgi:hypothetical protein
MGEELMTTTLSGISTAVERRERGCGCGGGSGGGCGGGGCGGGGCGGGCGGTCTCAWTGGEGNVGLERTRFYPRQIVTPDDLTQDQVYFRDKYRRHNRLLHGWGLVCGLVVERCAAPNPQDGEDPCRVRVTGGYALDPYGDEVVVPDDVVIDLCQEDLTGALACLPHDDVWCRPVQTQLSGTCYLAVRTVERAIKPVRAPTGCSCDESACEHSRYRDDHEFRLLDELPEHYRVPCQEGRFNPCEGVEACPPCPTSGWILLATVMMRGSAIEALTTDNRRHVMSLAGYCLDCSMWPRQSAVKDTIGPRRKLLGVASGTPDAMVTVDAVVDGRRADIVLPVLASDLKGKTAEALAAAWASVSVFDTDEPTAPLFPASWLLAHSRLEGDWRIESAEDLGARLGTPVIDTTAYPARLAAVRGVLDSAGERHLHQRLLDNVDRLDEVPAELLRGVSRDTADVLANARDVHSLGALRGIVVDDLVLSDAVKKRIATIRDTLWRG